MKPRSIPWGVKGISQVAAEQNLLAAVRIGAAGTNRQGRQGNTGEMTNDEIRMTNKGRQRISFVVRHAEFVISRC
jgi:hypothetical protein